MNGEPLYSKEEITVQIISVLLVITSILSCVFCFLYKQHRSTIDVMMRQGGKRETVADDNRIEIEPGRAFNDTASEDIDFHPEATIPFGQNARNMLKIGKERSPATGMSLYSGMKKY